MLFLDRNSPRALFSILNRFHDPCLLRPSSPYGRLISLCSATLLRDAVDYNLHLSVLLKGARGTGKFTTACWVAQQIGMHILEVFALYHFFSSFYLSVSRRSTATTSSEKMTPKQKAPYEPDSKSSKSARPVFFFSAISTASPRQLKSRNLEKVSLSAPENLPLHPFSEEPVLTTVLRECIDNVQNSWRISGHPIMVFATTANAERVPMGILSCFKHEIAFEVI